jgi:hypothetical protein
MKKLLILIFLLLIPLANAQTIGIGVEPSFASITIRYNTQVMLKFKFWNEGDTDAIYALIPEGNLTEFIVLNNSEYWHNEIFTVPKNTQRLSGFVNKTILFESNRNETIPKFETGISVYGEPSIPSQPGIIQIKRRIFVKMFLENYPEIPKPTSTSSTTTTTTIPTTTTSAETETGIGSDSNSYSTTSTSTTSTTTSLTSPPIFYPIINISSSTTTISNSTTEEVIQKPNLLGTILIFSGITIFCIGGIVVFKKWW